MAGVIAHYWFADEIFKAIPNEVKEVIKSDKDIYIFAAQGPDFLYANFIKPSVANLGRNIHNKKIYDVFHYIENLYNETNDGSVLAYLMGLLTHYCLDRNIHPYVNTMAKGYLKSFLNGANYNDSLRHITFECDIDQRVTIDKLGYAEPTNFNIAICIPNSRSIDVNVLEIYRGINENIFYANLVDKDISNAIVYFSLMHALSRNRNANDNKRKFIELFDNIELARVAKSYITEYDLYDKRDCKNISRREWFSFQENRFVNYTLDEIFDNSRKDFFRILNNMKIDPDTGIKLEKEYFNFTYNGEKISEEGN